MSNKRASQIKQFAGKMGLIGLVCVYLMLSVGILKATHFCMGRESSVAFFTGNSKGCVCEVFEVEKDGCCDDQQDLIRIENDQKNLSNLTLLPSPQWVVIESSFSFEPLYQTLKFENDHGLEDFSPPPIPLFKVNCSFVFYDGDLTA